MHSKPGLSPAMVGLIAAVITVSIWTSFIVIARASAQLTLRPLDIAFVRLVGAAAVLMPWGWWINRQAARAGQPTGWLGVSPLPARTTMVCGLFGGLLYGILVYSGFFLAPAAHASVLMPGSLPLWTALLALWLLRERISAPRALGLAF
ncbi:MAG: EamA/RhaT family transporter, partial [Betaproteobacteria bacterium]|nr:EamA/RhaT family transporter [Betaproteobacteria bacterium]